MITALVAAAQVAIQLAPWAEVHIDDTRGGMTLIQVFPEAAAYQGDLNAPVVLRKTDTFAHMAPVTTWADSRDCPGVRQSLDALRDVTLGDFTIDRAIEPPSPAPLHRPTGRLRVGGAMLPVTPGSRLGIWLQGVLNTTSHCWKPEP